MARQATAPQQDRSVATRERILAATLTCLGKVGYSATTTTAVEQKAKVSRGALLYHFPTRAILVSAAVERLFAELREEYQRAFAALQGGNNRVAAAIDLLWQTYQDPRLAAVLELYVAGRTDRELRKQLEPIADQHQQLVLGLARAFFPEAASKTRFSGTIHLVLDALQGMAVRQLYRPEDPAIRRTLTLLKEIAVAATQEP